jgi:hypothetical protein
MFQTSIHHINIVIFKEGVWTLANIVIVDPRHIDLLACTSSVCDFTITKAPQSNEWSCIKIATWDIISSLHNRSLSLSTWVNWWFFITLCQQCVGNERSFGSNHWFKTKGFNYILKLYVSMIVSWKVIARLATSQLPFLVNPSPNTTSHIFVHRYSPFIYENNEP